MTLLVFCCYSLTIIILLLAICIDPHITTYQQERSMTHTHHSAKAHWRRLALATLLITLGGLVVPMANAQTVNPSTEPLVQPSNMQYLGAFRAPRDGSDPKKVGISYGGLVLGFNPGTSGSGSLFISCNGQTTTVAEISIVVPTVSTNINSLQTAKYLQG